MTDLAELEKRPSMAAEHDLVNEVLPYRHPARDLRKVGATKAAIEDSGGRWAPIFGAEFHFRQSELQRLIPGAENVPELVLHLTDDLSEEGGGSRHAYFLFGGQDCEYVDTDAIAERYWRALDRFAVENLVAGWPDYDPGPEYPELRPWKRKGGPDDLLLLDRLSVDPIDQERSPDLAYDLTGDMLPVEHPAYRLQERGFTECAVNNNCNNYYAVKIFKTDVGPLAGVSKTVEVAFELILEGSANYELDCIEEEVRAYIDEKDDPELDTRLDRFNRQVDVSMVPAADLAAFRHFMNDTYENGVVVLGGKEND